MKRVMIGIPVALAAIVIMAALLRRDPPKAKEPKGPAPEHVRPEESVPAVPAPPRPVDGGTSGVEAAVNGLRTEIGAGANLMRAIRRQVEVLQQARETKPEAVKERVAGLLGQIANQRPAAEAGKVVREVDRLLDDPSCARAAAEALAQTLLVMREKAEEIAAEADRHVGAIELLRRREGIDAEPLIEFANGIAGYRDALRQAAGLMLGEATRLQSK